MTTDRIDWLLDQALVSGQIPVGATAEERAELERLLESADSLGVLRTAIDAEARASQPTARARFQRHMAASAAMSVPVARTVAPPRGGFFSRMFTFNRGLTLAGSIAAIAVLVVVGTFAAQSFQGVETASALVLKENDYAQVQGTVSGTSGEGPNRTVTVQSDFGELHVALSETTTVGGQSSGEAAPLKRGDSVTVVGTVSKREKVTAIAAVSLAVAAEPQPTPDTPKVRELRKAGPALEGTISVFTVSGDGRAARVLVDPGNGEHMVVRVGAESLARLLKSGSSPVGLRVRVTHEASDAAGEFTLTAINPPPAPSASPAAGATRPAETSVRGVWTSRQMNAVRVKTDRGEITVVIRPETRIVLGPGAGITVPAVREGDAAVGHEVSIQGFIDRATGRLVGEVIWIGPLAPK